MRNRLMMFVGLFTVTSALAKIDLVTLPTRDAVQVTIYNSADLTLVQESRAITLREGLNRLQFSWAKTLIDPTSLAMQPKANAGKVNVQDLYFPPRVTNLGVWNINSEVSGPVPMEIQYLTSGLSWRAFYMGTMSEDEKTMRVQGYVLVTNNSGEDYENAQTRLIVGKVNLLDDVAALAKREHPYGSPAPVVVAGKAVRYTVFSAILEEESLRRGGRRSGKEGKEDHSIKAVKKEGLSEYFLYTIEGRESIPTGWSKRLPSFDVANVPVVNLYKYEEERYGRSVNRFLSFTNDKKHELGETPIPGGMIKVYRGAGEGGRLAYEGQSSFKYIPVDQEVELDLGAAARVSVSPRLMDTKTDQYRFNGHGDIIGWDDTYRFMLEVKNTRPVSVKVEIQRNFDSSYWTLGKAGDFGVYEKVDLDTVKFALTLDPQTTKTFTYTVTLRRGTRESEK